MFILKPSFEKNKEVGLELEQLNQKVIDANSNYLDLSTTVNLLDQRKLNYYNLSNKYFANFNNESLLHLLSEAAYYNNLTPTGLSITQIAKMSDLSDPDPHSNMIQKTSVSMNVSGDFTNIVELITMLNSYYGFDITSLQFTGNVDKNTIEYTANTNSLTSTSNISYLPTGTNVNNYKITKLSAIKSELNESANITNGSITSDNSSSSSSSNAGTQSGNTNNTTGSSSNTNNSTSSGTNGAVDVVIELSVLTNSKIWGVSFEKTR